jgi:hypothetical protein
MANEQHQSQKPKSMSSSQPYDNALKGLMKDHADQILAQLIPDAELIREENNDFEPSCDVLTQYRSKTSKLLRRDYTWNMIA